ncbi:ABC transporter permease [Microbacterium sp.]|uniref:ABC transporter permease n=1 Tax=Microbacterium sp. TaxID=51671 RepID=UPI003C726685
MRLVPRGRESAWSGPIAVVAAVLVTLALTAGPIRLAGANPGAAYWRYTIAPLTSPTGIGDVLLAATPLIFTGIAVALAFRVGYYNIGAEGQFLAGAMAATVPALYLASLPAPVALPLGLAIGAVGGALWALVPALLRRLAGIDEVVTTLLLNPVALLLVQGLLNGPWRNSETGFPDSDRFGAGYELGELVPGSRVHWGFLIALAVVAVAWVVLTATPLGLALRATGLAPKAAAFSGIPVASLQFRTAIVSGALAGLGGAVQVFGVQHQLNASISGGYGYTGVVVAALGALTAWGALLVALLLSTITVGARGASISLQLPAQMGAIVSSTLLLSVVAALSLRHLKVVFSRSRKRGAD